MQQTLNCGMDMSCWTFPLVRAWLMISDWSFSDRKEDDSDWLRDRNVSDWLRGDEMEERSNRFQSVDWRTDFGDSDWSSELSNGRAV